MNRGTRETVHDDRLYDGANQNFRATSEANPLIPQSISFARYRAFREPINLELAPLNVIIGRNGSGKSVITRLPLLLSGGLSSRAEAPLDLDAGGVSHAVRFEDLIYQRSSQPFSFGATISDAKDTFRFRTTLRHVAERHILGIEAFELFQNEDLLVRLNVATPEDIGTPAGTFLAEFKENQTPKNVYVSFVGLFPMNVDGVEDEPLLGRLRSARDQFEAVFAAPSYLGPFRSEQGSLPRIPRQGVRTLGAKGEYALDILGNDRLRSDGALTTAVESWFESSMAGCRMNLTLAGDLPRMQVHDPLRNLDVDISETGAGFAQVLPIVVQSFAQRLQQIPGSLVIVEQPELHLHPAVHGNVMDLIIDTVKSDPDGIRYICETHSEQCITRLRRRIAEGVIAPSLVRVLSVGHKATEEDAPEPIRSISFDESGNPNAWPIGVFGEAFDDLVHLREATQRLAAEPRQPEATS